MVDVHKAILLSVMARASASRSSLGNYKALAQMVSNTEVMTKYLRQQ